MQTVKGYLSNGTFTPDGDVVLPRFAWVSVVINEVMEKVPLQDSVAGSQARLDGLMQVKAAIALARDEDLLNFPKQGSMRISFEDWVE